MLWRDIIDTAELLLWLIVPALPIVMYWRRRWRKQYRAQFVRHLNDREMLPVHPFPERHPNRHARQRRRRKRN